jgi:predicted Zn finger-like uncharacterized protein
VSLITRCPLCGTAFRVQASQLAAHSGTVRCGKCSGVFNGVASLVEEGDELVAFEPSPQLGLFDPGRTAAQSPAQQGAQRVPDFLATDTRSGQASWLWGLAALICLVALAAQLAYRFRAELAALLPATRAPVLAVCNAIGCDVPLPRHPELMSIDSSELEADTRREGLISLQAVIHNRARFAQEYPALELTLTDELDRPVLRRVLAPGDYLESSRAAQARQGIPAGSEAPLHIYLDSGRARASGYRLYLFYPL